MIKLIAFDLDNVLIDGEAIDELGKLMDVESEISEITEKTMEGEIDFGTSIKKRVALLKGAPVDDVKKVVDQIPLVKGVPETISELKKRGYKIATITGSFEIIAQRIKNELELDYAYSNVLHEEDGVLTGEVSGPLVEGSKAQVLQEIIAQENISTEECAAVGDGANDISMLKESGLGIAFNAKPVLKEIADIIIEKRDLRELLPIFPPDGKVQKSKKSARDMKYENKSFEELLTEKKKIEKKLDKLTAERDKLNEEARAHKQLRDELNSEIKENLDKALKYKEERDKTNEEVRKYKKKREEANKQLKKMEWSSGRRDIIQAQEEFKRLEKTIETRVLDIRKENELVKKATELRKKLQSMEEDEETQKEALKLRETSEKYHARVVELSEQAQEIHEKMLKYFEKIDEIRAKADQAHKLFIQTRKEASKKHEEVKSFLKEIRSINRALDKVKARERDKEHEITQKKHSKEKERAEEIYRKFREGKKLSTDELLLLQKHNIV